MLDLRERVHRECARTLEPPFVAGAFERLQERVAVPRGAVTEAGAFLLGLRRSCFPDQLGTREQELLVEVAACLRDDSRRAVAPLQARRPVRADRGRPVRAAV